MAAAKKKKSAKAGTRKSDVKRKKAKSQKKATVSAFSKKAVTTVFIVLAICWAAAWFFLSDADTRTANWISQTTLQFSASSGFRVENILVEGRVNSDSSAILGLLNVKKGDPLFSLKPAEAKDQMEKIGWIKSARVERRFPDTVYIELTERQPVALWQKDSDTLVLIDSEGYSLTVGALSQFKNLPMISGENAPQKASELMAALNESADLKALMDSAVLIDGRRWDVILKDEKRVNLPEKDMKSAIEHLMVRHAEEKILSKESITDIDARYKGRLIVKTKLGQVQDFKSDMKTNMINMNIEEMSAEL